jgi:putative ABC transport system permease protein
MLANHFKIAVRYLLKNRTFSLINIFGLTLGFLCLKEIGVRKVSGASVESIVGMVSKEFLVLVIIASVIAIPAAFYVMKNWLQDFAYRISMSAGIFASAGLLALFIAFVTIRFRSIKAAIANPVDSLRNE